MSGIVAFALYLFLWTSPASAQTSAANRDTQRADLNDSAIFIMAGRPGSAMLKVADDLAIALNDEKSSFRVVPIIGDGARGNIRDLILLRSVDLSITDFGALDKMKQSNGLSQMLHREIAQVVTLFPDKLQIFARTKIRSVKGLEGKSVGVGLKNSGTELHARAIFDALGVRVKQVNLAALDSAKALADGEIDAFVCFCSGAPEVYNQVMFDVDIHLLPVPFDAKLGRNYLTAKLVHKEFPSFIGKNETIDTVAVTLVLVTYNWKRDDPRYDRVAEFVELFFNNLSKLQKPPRHPGWSSVQIGATAPYWERFAAATEWQKSKRTDALQQMRAAFDEFLDKYSSESSSQAGNSDRLQLFEEFLAWRQSAR